MTKNLHYLSSHCSFTKWGGGGREGAFIGGEGAYFKFRPIEGAPQKGELIRGERGLIRIFTVSQIGVSFKCIEHVLFYPSFYLFFWVSKEKTEEKNTFGIKRMDTTLILETPIK